MSGVVEKATMSAGWLRKYGDDFSAVTIGYGRNDKNHGSQSSVFVETTRHFGANSIYGRFEAHQVETAVLATGTIQNSQQADTLLAFTLELGHAQRGLGRGRLCFPGLVQERRVEARFAHRQAAIGTTVDREHAQSSGFGALGRSVPRQFELLGGRRFEPN